MDHLGWMNRSDGGLKVFEKRGWIIIEREDVVWGLDFFGGEGRRRKCIVREKWNRKME